MHVAACSLVGRCKHIWGTSHLGLQCPWRQRQQIPLKCCLPDFMVSHSMLYILNYHHNLNVPAAVNNVINVFENTALVSKVISFLAGVSPTLQENLHPCWIVCVNMCPLLLFLLCSWILHIFSGSHMVQWHSFLVHCVHGLCCWA